MTTSSHFRAKFSMAGWDGMELQQWLYILGRKITFCIENETRTEKRKHLHWKTFYWHWKHVRSLLPSISLDFDACLLMQLWCLEWQNKINIIVNMPLISLAEKVTSPKNRYDKTISILGLLRSAANFLKTFIWPYKIWSTQNINITGKATSKDIETHWHPHIWTCMKTLTYSSKAMPESEPQMQTAVSLGHGHAPSAMAFTTSTGALKQYVCFSPVFFHTKPSVSYDSWFANTKWKLRMVAGKLGLGLGQEVGELGLTLGL